MTLELNPTVTYLRALQTDLSRFRAILYTRLEQLEEAQTEIYDTQTWLLENNAPLFILANQSTAVPYLSNHSLALIELKGITTDLLAVIQALLILVRTLHKLDQQLCYRRPCK
jgi:hypothetical protein